MNDSQIANPLIVADRTNPVNVECDHIVGLYLTNYPEDGGGDRLVRQSENEGFSVEKFIYCPICGCNLNAKKGTP